MSQQNELGKKSLKYDGNMSLDETIKDLLTPMQQAMNTLGITPEMLGKKLLDELEAKDTKFFAFQGEVISDRDIVAWDVRQKARQDAHKLRGDYAPEKFDSTLHGVRTEYTPDEEAILRKASEDLANEKIKEIIENDIEMKPEG